MDLEERVKLLEQMMKRVAQELELSLHPVESEMRLLGIAQLRVEGEPVNTLTLKDKVRTALELMVEMKSKVTAMIKLFSLCIGILVVTIVGLLYQVYRLW